MNNQENPYELLARREKAAKIAIVLAAHPPLTLIESYARQGDWDLYDAVARIVGVNSPSAATKLEVIRLYGETIASLQAALERIPVAMRKPKGRY